MRRIIPEAKKREVVVQANVVGVGVMSAKRESASVMVYMNRTVTDKSRQPRLRRQPVAGGFQEDRRQMADRLHHADLNVRTFQKHIAMSLQRNG